MPSSFVHRFTNTVPYFGEPSGSGFRQPQRVKGGSGPPRCQNSYNGIAYRCPRFSMCRAGGFISTACGEERCECKYWLQPERFDIVEEFEYNCTPRLRREVRQIIFAHFEQIIDAWREHFGGDRAR